MANAVCLICRKYQKDHTHLSFHNFPKCKTLKKIWLERLNLTNFEPKPNHDLICSDHFKKSCIIPGKGRRLISGSIPYLNKGEIDEEVEFAVNNNVTMPVGCVNDDVSESAVNNDTTAVFTNKDTMKLLVICSTNNLPPIVTEHSNMREATTTNECHSESSPTNREVIANVGHDHTYSIPPIIDHKKLERTMEIVKDLKSLNVLLKRKLRRAKQKIRTLRGMIPRSSTERKETNKVFCEF